MISSSSLFQINQLSKNYPTSFLFLKLYNFWSSKSFIYPNHSYSFPQISHILFLAIYLQMPRNSEYHIPPTLQERSSNFPFFNLPLRHYRNFETFNSSFHIVWTAVHFIWSPTHFTFAQNAHTKHLTWSSCKWNTTIRR